MADHAKPTLGSSYANFVAEINGRLQDLARGLDPAKAPATGLPTDSVAWNSAAGRWDRWTGAAWTPLASVYAITAQAAQRLAAGVTVGLTGDVSGTSAAWDGSGNVSVNSTLATVLASPGTVGSATEIPVLTFDAKGRCTGIGRQAMSFWHAGNFNPASYLPLSGGALTGELRLPANQNLTFGAGYSSGAATISGNNGALNLYPGGSSSGATVQLTPTLANFTTPGQFSTAVYVGAYQVWHAGNVDPFRFTGWITNPGADANAMPSNRSSFTYANNAPNTGAIVHFDASGYGLQLNSDYSTGNLFSFRTRNGDGNVWNAWRHVWHSGNFDPNGKASLSGGAVFQGSGSFNAFHIRSTDASNWSWFSMGSTGPTGPQAWHLAVNAQASDGMGANALHIRPQAGASGTKLGIESDGTVRAFGAIVCTQLVAADRIGSGFDPGVSGSFGASNWFRSSGATGWYNSTYGVGIFSQSSGAVSVYGAVGVGFSAPGRLFGNAGVNGAAPAGNGLGAITVSSADPSGGAQGDIWFKV